MEVNLRFLPLKIIRFPETQNDNIKTHFIVERNDPNGID